MGRRGRAGRPVRVPAHRADPGQHQARRGQGRDLPGPGGTVARRLAGSRCRVMSAQPFPAPGPSVGAENQRQPQSWRGAWVAALDDLEMDVESTEAMLADSHRMAQTPRADPWQAPQDLGALPLELKPRADEILTRQLA